MNYSTRGQKVMVVEHDRTILEIIELRLEVAGYDPAMARTGRSAIESLRNFKPAALVLDMDLPDMNGLEVLKAINPLGQRHTVPTLLFARQLGEADLKRALELGIRDCLTKPFSGEQILTRLTRMLKQAGIGPARQPAPVLL